MATVPRPVMLREIDGISYFTIPEAAKELQTTPTTLKAYLKQGRLKSERIGPAQLISERELRHYQAKRGK